MRPGRHYSGMNSHELVVVSGPDSGSVIDLRRGRQSVGRSPAASLRIDDPSIAPHHALVQWHPPSLTAVDLGGRAVCDGPVLLLGNSRCEVREVRLLDEVGPKMFHRPPVESVEVLTPPAQPIETPAPNRPTAPPIAAIATGVVTGTVMALVTRQMLFGLFALTTAVITAATWAASRLSFRRATRRWQRATRAKNEIFAAQCTSFARRLVDERRRNHRTIGELLHDVERGGKNLWSRRSVGETCIGYETREFTIAEDSPPVVIMDNPRTVDLTSGRVLGIHGERSVKVVRAMLTRLAVEVGPSDWSLILVGEKGPQWEALEKLPHYRTTPLDRYDIEVAESGDRHRVLLVTDREKIAHRTAIARRLLRQPRVSMIVVADKFAELPAVCSEIVDADESNLDGMSSDSAVRLARALGRWIDPDNEASSIPKHVALSRLVRADSRPAKSSPAESSSFESASTEWLIGAWQRESSAEPRALVGESSDGPIEIDFCRDGPHAVVVGTTGSGKSEFLRTMVTSLACRCSPEDLVFVLIDYKGGAAFDACVRFPHVVGVITDLDEGLAARVLISLEAELRHRERQLRIAPNSRLPRLMVVVDELAALKEDVPDFIGSLVTIAQRGRSLGLHLVVATQRPGAALSADVTGNANIRVALRVQSPNDSYEIVGANIAAGFSRDVPGRACLRLGVDELFTFQSARVDSDFADIESAMVEAAQRLKLAPPRRPWLDPLPKLLTENSVEMPRELDPREFVVGVLDDPAWQTRHPLIWDSSQPVFIVGGSKSGKSTAVATMRNRCIASATHGNVFSIAGAGSGSDHENHVDVSDREMLRRLLVVLTKRLDGPIVLDESERWVLFVDDVDIWRNYFVDDRIGRENWVLFERIFLEGSKRNISCVVTGAQFRALPNILSSRVRQVWSLSAPPGRCTVAWDDRELQGQLFGAESAAKSERRPGRTGQLLRRLPTMIDAATLEHADSWAVSGDDLREIAWPSTANQRICVLGGIGSGIDMVIDSLTRAWRARHPQGRVVDARDWQNFRGIWPNDWSPATLVVADAGNYESIEWMNNVVRSDVASNEQLSIVAGASPNFMRAHPEHWINVVRRSRTGLLLGRAGLDDGELLGIYANHDHVFGEAVGRGLWVVDGCAVGIVQSASAKFEAIAQQDLVTPLVLLDPAETDEAADGFVDSLARGPDHAGEFFLSDRQNEFVGARCEFEQTLGGASCDVEEDRVGQCAVHDS